MIKASKVNWSSELVIDIHELLERGKEDVALVLSNDCSDFSEYAHINLLVAYVVPDKGRYNESIGYYNNYFNEKNKYKDLKISCQMDSRKEQPYAWQLGISQIGSGSFNLADAEEMVKTLRPINRKLLKIVDTEGSPDTFEEYVSRIVRVLGVKAFYEKVDGNLQFSRCNEMSLLRSRIKTLIKQNNEKLGFVKEAA